MIRIIKISIILIFTAPLFCYGQEVNCIDLIEKTNYLYYLPNDTSPFSGKCVGYHNNGKKMHEKTILDGMENGLFKKMAQKRTIRM